MVISIFLKQIVTSITPTAPNHRQFGLCGKGVILQIAVFVGIAHEHCTCANLPHIPYLIAWRHTPIAWRHYLRLVHFQYIALCQRLLQICQLNHATQQIRHPWTSFSVEPTTMYLWWWNNCNSNYLSFARNLLLHARYWLFSDSQFFYSLDLLRVLALLVHQIIWCLFKRLIFLWCLPSQ